MANSCSFWEGPQMSFDFQFFNNWGTFFGHYQPNDLTLTSTFAGTISSGR